MEVVMPKNTNKANKQSGVQLHNHNHIFNTNLESYIYLMTLQT